MPGVTVVRTYLEQREQPQLPSSRIDDPSVRVIRVTEPDVPLFRTLYRDVGGPYHWQDRNLMSDEALRDHFALPTVELWVLYVGQSPAGFFELQRHSDASVEIVYFGIASKFFGRGLGKHLLTRAVEQAWQSGAQRVWLHTCTLDAPSALPNYLARGFEPYRTETYEAQLPPSPM
jgi:GNAT superfamily N-acetyltransferase